MPELRTAGEEEIEMSRTIVAAILLLAVAGVILLALYLLMTSGFGA